MANLTESATWEPNVFQLELSTPATAGPGGVMNTQAQQLANRTAYLKGQVEDTRAYTLGMRRANINGDFAIWNRGTSFANPASGTRVTVGWQVSFGSTSGAVRDVSRVEIPPSAGLEARYAMRFEQVSVTASSFIWLRTRIEDVRRFAGQPVCISAKFYREYGTPRVRGEARQNFGTGGGASSATQTGPGGFIDIPTDGGWHVLSNTFTLPAITDKTIGTDENHFVEPLIALSPFDGSFALHVTDVQFELGTVPTPYERRPLAVEEAITRRYYQVVPFVLATSHWTQNIALNQLVNPPMRANPSVTVVPQSGTGGTVGALASGLVYQTAHHSASVSADLRLDAEL